MRRAASAAREPRAPRAVGLDSSELLAPRPRWPLAPRAAGPDGRDLVDQRVLGDVLQGAVDGQGEVLAPDGGDLAAITRGDRVPLQVPLDDELAGIEAANRAVEPPNPYLLTTGGGAEYRMRAPAALSRCSSDSHSQAPSPTSCKPSSWSPWTPSGIPRRNACSESPPCSTTSQDGETYRRRS